MTDIRATKAVEAIRSTNKQHKPRHGNSSAKQTGGKTGGGCLNCGDAHSRDATCPAAHSTCHYCKKTGHYAKVCFGKKRNQNKQGSQQHKGNKKKVHQVENDNDQYSSDEDEHGQTFTLDSLETKTVHAVRTKSQAFANIAMTVQNATTSIKCKIDSGAEENVMPVRVFKELFPKHIYTSKARLLV